MRRILLASALAFPVLAHAQGYAPTLPRGGMDPRTAIVNPATGVATTMGAAVSAAMNAVPGSMVGAPNGVAPLDGNGNSTAPVLTPGQIHVGSVASQYFPITGLTLPASSQFSVGDNLGASILDPRAVLIGGHRYGDSSPTYISATPYGGSGLGSVLDVSMTQKGVGGLQPALAPFGTDGAGGISSYPEMDAGVIYSYGGSNSPYVEAGADIAGDDGVAHSVTYDATHAYFSPALPSSMVARMRPLMHVMTNSIGATRTNPANYLQPNNDYAGEIQAIDPGGSSITVGGWRVLNSGNTSPTQNPQGAAIDAATWPQYAHPAIFIGVYTHSVSYNPQCFLRAQVAGGGGDTNSPNGSSADMPVNDCEIEEADLQNNMPDYTGRAKGILVTYNGPSQASLDSYDFFAAGTTPNGYLAYNGTLANNFLSDGFYAHGNNGVNSGTDPTTGDTVGAAGDTRVMAENIGASAVQPNGTGSGDKVSMVTYEQLVAATSNMGANPYSNVSVNLGYVFNGTTTQVGTQTGAQTITQANLLDRISFNPDGVGSLGLFAGSGTTGLLLSKTGNVRLTGAGAQLILAPTNGDPAPYIYAPDGVDFRIGSASGAGVNFHTFSSTTSIVQPEKPDSQTLSIIKNDNYGEGTQVWCHDCTNPGQATGKGTGQPVYIDSAGTVRSVGTGAAAGN